MRSKRDGQRQRVIIFPCAYHAVLLVIVAKYWKTATVTESSYFLQRFIINIFGYCY